MRRRIFWLIGLVVCGLAGVFFVSTSSLTSSQLPAVNNALLAAQAQNEPAEPEALTLGGSYEDPQGRFQIGILSGFSVSPVSGSVLLEAPNGTLAYSVTVVPAGSPGEETVLTDAALAQIVKNTFATGEGFQPTGFQTLAGGGVQIPWVGRLTLGANTQAVQGLVLARQAAADVYLLAIASTEGTAQAILPTLVDSLEVL
ncbi:MAG: hypothetical protein HC886_03845 [Leptolyngbyaceae cyanobacterium SM1_1_3]|nr:hypothetical protein [Leptolyngbyaceae cyanobacterium SM1_1_3]